jgi:hypothetical protein
LLPVYRGAATDPGDREFMQKVSTEKDGRTKPVWSCHGVARAYARLSVLRWAVADGCFHRIGQRHSWLWRRVHNRVIILDVYPIATPMPLIVDASVGSPWSALYIDTPRYYTLEEASAWEAEAQHALEQRQERHNAV